jgi:hypothetical protein
LVFLCSTDRVYRYADGSLGTIGSGAAKTGAVTTGALTTGLAVAGFPLIVSTMVLRAPSAFITVPASNAR